MRRNNQQRITAILSLTSTPSPVPSPLASPLPSLSSGTGFLLSSSSIPSASLPLQLPLPYQFEYDNNVEDIPRPTPQVQSTDPVGDDYIFDDNSLEKVVNEETQRKWKEVVQSSVKTLKTSLNREDKRVVNSLSITDIFTRDGARYIVKATQRKYFEIFPWFLVYKDVKNHRFRESLSDQRAEEIVEALKFFWRDSFDKHDLKVITKFCFAPPRSCLSPIHDLKQDIVKNRESTQFRQDLLHIVKNHESRLSRLEEKFFTQDSHEDHPTKKRRQSTHEENISLEITLGDHDMRLRALEGETLESSFHAKLSTNDDDLVPGDYQSSDFDDNTESSYSHGLSDDDYDFLRRDLQNISRDPTPSLDSDASPPPSPSSHNGEEEIASKICSKSTLIVELLNQIMPSTPSFDGQSPTLDLTSIDTNLDSILSSLQNYRRENFD